MLEISYLAMDLVNAVKKKVKTEKLIAEGDHILLAISGGIDSTTLLFVLLEIKKSFPFTIGLAHVNHSLRGEESDRDELFVRNLANNLLLPVHVTQVYADRHARETGLSLQHAGRELRYQFFQKILSEYGYNKIATAHNLDDQIETFLLRVIKGTGLNGLSSIPVKRQFVIRPFLSFYREDIELYAREKQIHFVEDSSNQKTAYERNYVRKEIIPLMLKLNPACKDRIHDLINNIKMINDTINVNTDMFISRYRKLNSSSFNFNTNKLKTLDEETLYRVISNSLGDIHPGFIPLRSHFVQIKKIIDASKPNMSCNLPQGIKVKKAYNVLAITKHLPEPRIPIPLSLSYGHNYIETLSLNLRVSVTSNIPERFTKRMQTAYFDFNSTGELSVRTFQPGDRFYPFGMNKPVKLKDYFISQKIPRDERKSIPLLLSDNVIIWVIGHRIDNRYKVTSKTKKILKITASYKRAS